MLTEELHVKLTELFRSPFIYQLYYFSLISVKIILKRIFITENFSQQTHHQPPTLLNVQNLLSMTKVFS